jgi:hypothetical protein
MIKINKNLAFFLGLLFIVISLKTFILSKGTPFFDHVTYYCQSFINTQVIEIPYILSISPMVVITSFLLFGLFKLFTLIVKSFLLSRSLKKNVEGDNTINMLINKLDLKDKVLIIDSSERFAFCLGLRPKIFISTGLLSYLSIEEIEAVLRHEQYHLQNHDTLIMTLATVAHSLLPFFPLLNDVIKKYKVDREIQADDFARRHIGSSYPILSTLKKLLIAPTKQHAVLASISDHDTLEPRIYRLINKPYKRIHFHPRSFLVSLLSLIIFAGFIVVPAYAKEIHHDEHDVIMVCPDGTCNNSCSSGQNIHKLH